MAEAVRTDGPEGAGAAPSQHGEPDDLMQVAPGDTYGLVGAVDPLDLDLYRSIPVDPGPRGDGAVGVQSDVGVVEPCLEGPTPGTFSP